MVKSMHRNIETECNIVIILENIHFLRFLAKKTFLVRKTINLQKKDESRTVKEDNKLQKLIIGQSSGAGKYYLYY